MGRKAIQSPGAATVGPYSNGVDSQGLLFLSGQTPLDLATGKLVEGGVEAQTRQCFENLRAVLEAGGLSLDDVQKVNMHDRPFRLRGHERSLKAAVLGALSRPDDRRRYEPAAGGVGRNRVDRPQITDDKEERT